MNLQNDITELKQQFTNIENSIIEIKDTIIKIKEFEERNEQHLSQLAIRLAIIEQKLYKP